MISSEYAPLWCKSNGSFLEGASHPGELIEQAASLGLRSIAITDRDGLYGIVQAHQKAKDLSIKLLIGAQVTVGFAKDQDAQNDRIGIADVPSTLVLLVQDRDGYANLCRLLTIGRRHKSKGESKVTWDEVCGHAGGLLALWGGDASHLIREPEPDDIAGCLCDAFGDRLYAMVARHHRDTEIAEEKRLRTHAARYGLPCVAAVEVLYHDQARRPLQDVMTCIRHRVTVHTAGRLLQPNANHALLDARAFVELFADDPEAVARTNEVAARCAFSLSQIRYRYPAECLPNGMTSSSWLRHLAYEGARKRYEGKVPHEVTAQLDRELRLIEELDYGGYFLTMYEIVEFCRARGILCQGRGSAANSVVCYVLGVTAVDPIRVELLFERFLSKERNEPPDIDLDVMHERREEVIQYIYEKYGRDRAAMVANVVRYQPRSAIRDVGKALGISETALDRLAKLVSYPAVLTDGALRQAGFDPQAPLYRHLLQLATEILNAPRHLSIHPGGFLLGHEPVHDIVPIENATMAGRTVIQWDKDDVEAMGLFKVDILGLGALTQLDLCFRLLEQHRGLRLSMATIPEGDEETYEMICRGDTVGVFQIESRAQMSMLPRLRPKTYYDLVIQISIVRPGPISGGMVHPYLRRRNGEEEVTYPHDCLIPVLEKTKGVPLFQEQVMRLAIAAADYTPGEADQLRRDMAAWRRSGRLEAHRKRLVTRMIAKGIASEFADRVFKQICGFGEYGFPESHAASFALISYAAAYLRRHYPAEFTCALLNAQPMGFYSISTIVEDAKRQGIEVRPVDAQQSEWDCTLEEITPAGTTERQFAVRMGLRFVKNIGEANAKQMVSARAIEPFSSLEDVTRRSKFNERALSAMAEAGAFDTLNLSRRPALWEVAGVTRDARRPLSFSGQDAVPPFLPLQEAELVAWDYQASSHSTRGHPLASFRPFFRAQGIPDAQTVRTLPPGTRVRYAGLVICRQHPQTASNTTFMTLEDETGFVNLVIWDRVFQSFSVLARTASLLGVTGTIDAQSGVVHLIAQRLWAPQAVDTPKHVKSRDFR